ncbi:hypothetical protein FQY83_10655 [Luteimonas marina]|uniref:Uncharacterized protein n=1 Tax=Luteimonas marina TaxID=488485 RepID=A0A5C5U1A5_9GAMM|nr:hypothetical protein [Luteimonas marina]TWT20193.1 hypothetical protein FQY83_10655 [Luteimonas marina]
MTYKRVVNILCGTVLVSFAAAGVIAGETQVDGAASPDEAMPVTYHGVQVFVDPATGKLQAPSAAQRQALGKVMQQDRAAALARRPRDEIAARSTLRTSRTGQVAALVQVPDSHFSHLVAERQADGSIRINHGNEPEQQATDAVAEQEVTP